MEIKNNNLHRLDPHVNRADLEKARGGARHGAQAARADKPGAGNILENNDKVTLSSDALKEVVEQEAANAPGIRRDKVAQIRARLETGEYQVDARDIAGKILSEPF